jgi:membrane protein DedA with SNARE-associated domain
MDLVLAALAGFFVGGWASYLVQKWQSRPIPHKPILPPVEPSHPGPVTRRPRPK